MTSKEIDNLAQRIGEYFHLFKDYTLFEFDNTEKDVSKRVEQLKPDLTDIGAIDEIIFDINDCNKNLDDSYSSEANALIKQLGAQRKFLERKEETRMVGDTHYEVKHAIHVGDKEIVFAEDKNAADGMNWFVGDYTSNQLFGQYADCQVSDDYLEAMQDFTDRIKGQIEAVRDEIRQINLPPDIFTSEHCYPNDYGQSIDGKIVAIKAEVLRPEYRRGDVQLVLVDGGNGAKANPVGRAVYCYHLNNGEHTRFERHDIQGEVRPEFLPAWAKEKAAAIQAEKAALPQKNPKARDER